MFLILILISLGFYFFSNMPPVAQLKNNKDVRPISNIAVTTNPVKSNDTLVPSEMPPVTSDTVVNSEKPRQLSADEIDELRGKTKSFLAALYTAQKAFHTEYNQYITDYIAIGISPAEPILPFKAGFLESSEEPLEIPIDANIDARRLDSDFFVGEKDRFTNETIQYGPFVRDINLSSYKEFCKNRCTADSESFEMLIATPLGNHNQIDVWLVNDKKEFILVQDGTNTRQVE